MLGVNVVPVPVHVPPTDKVDVAVLAVITPLEKVTLPLTVRSPPVKVRVLDAPLKDKLLAAMPAADTLGQFPLVTELGIVTAVDDVGTLLPHQLPAVFHSVLVVPVHVPAVHPVVTVTMPVAELSNQVSFLLVAAEELEPHVPLG